MPSHEILWPLWTAEEVWMTVWFASLGLEVPDVARLLQHKLHTRPHTLEAFWNKMKRINEEQVGHGYPPLCNPGMLDWDKAAVDDFLIRQTNDTYLLKHLLWFGHEHICLLATGHDDSTTAYLYTKSWTWRVSDASGKGFFGDIAGTGVVHFRMTVITSVEKALLGCSTGTKSQPQDICVMYWAQFVERHASVDNCTFPFYGGT